MAETNGRVVLDILQSAYKLRALKLSMAAMISVVFVEVAVGLAVNSLAILSDGLHALLDVLTILLLFVTTRESAKPPDEEHMYGHEKFESIGGLIGGIALVAIALAILYEAVQRMLTKQSINFGLEYVGFAAVGFTFCINLFRVNTSLKARKSESTAMKAVFYDALADLCSTTVAFLGFGLATLGFPYGDSLASLVLGTLLTFLSLKVIWASGMELTDTISKNLADTVKHEIIGTEGVSRLESLKMRKAGEKTFVTATVQVPDYLNLDEAHELTSKIELNIKKVCGNCDVAIHTEPCKPEMPTETLVEKLTLGVEGVKEVHEIGVVHSKEKLYITLHANVDPKTTIENAHRIADSIENRIKERIPEVEDVTVHMEPYNSEIRKGLAANEEEIRRLIQSMTETYQQVFRVRGITTYAARKKRYISIKCSFSKQVSLEEAHKIASQLEEKLQEHFVETAVTVHIESS